MVRRELGGELLNANDDAWDRETSQIMKLVARTNAASEIEALLLEWCDLLAAEAYESAYNLVDHDSELTEDIMRALINNYGLIEPVDESEKYVVTDYRRAAGNPNNPNPQISWFESTEATNQNATIGQVHFDLPLSGQWSDLTSIFSILSHDSDHLTLRLDELHVL